MLVGVANINGCIWKWRRWFVLRNKNRKGGDEKERRSHLGFTNLGEYIFYSIRGSGNSDLHCLSQLM